MLSIVIPAHNEEGNIARVVCEFYDKVVAHRPGAEMIVVDDVSRDRTTEIVEELARTRPALRVVRAPCNLGHGGSIRYGFGFASNAWVFYTDGDHQTRAGGLIEMLEHIDEYDVQFGYRQRRGDGLQREIVTRVLRLVVLAATGARLRDANCPYKLMPKSLWARLDPVVPADTPAAMVCLASLIARMPLRLRNVPVEWHERQAGRASISKWWAWVGVGRHVARDLRRMKRIDPSALPGGGSLMASDVSL